MIPFYVIPIAVLTFGFCVALWLHSFHTDMCGLYGVLLWWSCLAFASGLAIGHAIA